VIVCFIRAGVRIQKPEEQKIRKKRKSDKAVAAAYSEFWILTPDFCF
jgi:hypothetical protein